MKGNYYYFQIFFFCIHCGGTSSTPSPFVHLQWTSGGRFEGLALSKQLAQMTSHHWFCTSSQEVSRVLEESFNTSLYHAVVPVGFKKFIMVPVHINQNIKFWYEELQATGPGSHYGLITTVGPVQNLSVSLHVYKDSMPALYKLTFLLYLPLMYHYSTMYPGGCIVKYAHNTDAISLISSGDESHMQEIPGRACSLV